MIYVYRMVGRLSQLVQYSYLAACLGCCREYSQSELFTRYRLRTAEGEQYSTWCYLLYGGGIQFLIAA